MNAHGKIRPCDLARRWGINPSYITRLVKRGCPLTSFEEADTWRMANAPPRRTSLVMTGSGGRSPDALNDPEIVIDADANSDGQESVLVRHRENEHECWQALRRARDTGTPAEALAATRNYNEASAARMKTETAYEVYLEKTGTLVPMATATRILGEQVLRLKGMLNVLPATACAQCNPNNPGMAAAVLRDSVHDILMQMSQSPPDEEESVASN